MLASFFGERGPFPKVSMQTGSTEAVKQAVKAGLGVSLVLAACVEAEIRAGTCVLSRSVMPGWPRT
ncbi:LysR substrate-binding domain-containing protein [Halomonas sp. PA16-9]|uniref:LysR substrate-binding domain-containing protein n=1 Tax=Halomonas sp. PA16-9 TaxID=2576841 RepID=UPI0030EDAC46